MHRRPIALSLLLLACLAPLEATATPHLHGLAFPGTPARAEVIARLRADIVERVSKRTDRFKPGDAIDDAEETAWTRALIDENAFTTWGDEYRYRNILADKDGRSPLVAMVRRAVERRGRLIDFGAGHAYFLLAMLRRHPELRGLGIGIRHPARHRLGENRAELPGRFDYIERDVLRIALAELEGADGAFDPFGAFSYGDAPDRIIAKEIGSVVPGAHVLAVTRPGALRLYDLRGEPLEPGAWLERGKGFRVVTADHVEDVEGDPTIFLDLERTEGPVRVPEAERIARIFRGANTIPWRQLLLTGKFVGPDERR